METGQYIIIGWILSSQNWYVDVLIPSTLQCDYI